MRFAISLMLLAAAPAFAQEDAIEPDNSAANESVVSTDAVKTLSGMSILGNEEAPKSLVIVPWKSSQLSDGLGIANALDGSPRAVDKEVFLRELHFYDLRSGGKE